MQFSFGSGNLYGIPSPQSTPVLFGVLQEISVDISFSIKELFGQNQFPVAIGRGQAKITCKAKTAQFQALTFNELFTGATSATGMTQATTDPATAIPTTPFTITPVHADTFIDDLGVTYDATGIPLTWVVSAPAVGQYTFNQGTGVYTFAAADVGLTVDISYSYTSAGAGYTSSVNNTPMGTAPTFMVVLSNPYQGNNLFLRLYSCTATKLSMAFKNEDFAVPEFDFEAFANAAGKVYQLSTQQ